MACLADLLFYPHSAILSDKESVFHEYFHSLGAWEREGNPGKQIQGRIIF